MLVNRWTFNVKIGRMSEAVDLAKEAKNFADIKRMYVSNVGEQDRLCAELEFEDYAAYGAYWSAWGEDLDNQAWLKKWQQLIERPVLNEIWELQ